MTNSISKPRLVGDQVILRAPIVTDVDDRLALGRDPKIIRMFGGDPTKVLPMTQDVAQKWVDDRINHTTAWIIEAAGKCVGDIRLDSVNPNDARGILAIGILDTALLGRGFGSEAMRLLLKHAFDTMGLHRVSLRVLEYNTRAIAAYKKLGFVEEGREREAGLVQGQRYDDLIMGILASEFAPSDRRLG